MNEPKMFEASMAKTAGARGAFADPLSLASKPPVIFKFASSVLSLIVYSCVSSAWYDGRCLFNGHSGICQFGSLTLISFITCVALLVLELVFSQISSLKIRRRVAIADVIISGTNTIIFLLLFVFLAIAWLKSPPPHWGISINSCRFAILLSFLAIFALAACTGLAYVRYQSGVDMSQFMTEDQIVQEQAQYYDQNGNYIDPMQQQQIGNFSNNNLGYAMDPSQYSATSSGYMSYDPQMNPNQQ